MSSHISRPAFALLLVFTWTGCWLPAVAATQYYISSSLGSDSNSGTSPTAAWASLVALNKRTQQLQPGDVVHLCNTDLFLGQHLDFSSTSAAAESQLAVSSSSSSFVAAAVSVRGDWICGNGSSSTAVISPAQRLPPKVRTGGAGGWSRLRLGGKDTGLLSYDLKREVNAAASSALTAAPVVTALWTGGGQQRMLPARSPNLLNFQQRQGVSRAEFWFVNGSETTRSTVVSASLAAFPDNHFINSTIRIRTSEWTYETRSITQQQAAQLQLDWPTSYLPNTVFAGNSFGFYLEAAAFTPLDTALAMLDAPGEYWYDGKNQTLFLRPLSSVQAERLLAGEEVVDAVFDTTPAAVVIEGLQRFSLSLSSLQFTRGGAHDGVWVGSCSSQVRVDLADVIISNIAGNGLSVGTASSESTPAQLTLSSSVISDVDNNCVSISLMAADHPADSRRATIQSSLIQRCGLWAGQGQSGDGGAQGVAVEHTLLQNNEIQDIGYTGVRPAYWSIVQHNSVLRVMLSLNDGANIYAWGLPGVGVQVLRNLVVNATGNVVSSPASYGIFANSLYLDDGDYDNLWAYNVCLGASNFCLFYHNTHNTVTSYTVCADGGIGLQSDRWDLPMYNNSLSYVVLYRNASMSYNTALGPFVTLRSGNDSAAGWYTGHHNVYCDELSDSVKSQYPLFELDLRWSPVYYNNLTAWKQATSSDPDDGILGCVSTMESTQSSLEGLGKANTA